jgi:hypothetical protein
MLGCGLALLLTARPGMAQQSNLPDGLRHVPPDAIGFLHVRAGEFLRNDLGKQLMKELQQDREASRALQKLENDLGTQVADIDSVTLILLSPPNRPQVMPWELRHKRPLYKRAPPPLEMPIPVPPKVEEKKAEGKEKESPVVFQDFFLPREPFVDDSLFEDAYPGSPEPVVIVTSTRPLDRKKILRSQFLQSRARDPYGNPRADFSVLFLTDRSVMLGAPSGLAHYSEQMARKPGPKTRPMESAVAFAARPSLVTIGAHLSPEARRTMLSPGSSEVLASLVPLLQTEAALSFDLGKHVDLRLQFQAPTEANAEQAVQAIKSARVLVELALEKSEDAGEQAGWKRLLDSRVKEALASATIEQKQNTVRAQIKLELDPAVIKRYTKEVVYVLRQKGDRAQSVNNLKQIGLAMHGYHDANKRLPPAGITSVNDPNGKPLLSWRVAILPYIDQAPLYQQFDLTQPWDSPQNKKLIAKMPQIYVVPGTESKEPGMTHYRVLVGPTTMFEPGQKITLVSVTDGTSNTIMAVEAKEPTIWTRPDDLPFDPKGPLPKFGVSPDGFNALFGDGVVRFIRSTTPEETLRALITRNGGEVVQLPDDR